MSDNSFESVLSWLYAERDYQKEKFNYKKQTDEVFEEKTVDYWLQQFASYEQRLPIFGFENPAGVQTALKLAATAVALCEYLAEKGQLPKPGVSSGVIEKWNSE